MAESSGKSDKIRVGVIGCGGMAQGHMKVFGELPRYQFTAASDNFAANLDKAVATYGVKGFADGHELIKSGLCDAIVIATPHYFHPEYALAGLKAGLHVLTEKPVSVTAGAAAEVNKAALANPQLRYAAMFQFRSSPRLRKAKQIIDQGTLGPIRRVQWTCTGWFRTQAYYNSGSWRATWAGEGGGVLLNQCPHNLDVLYWLAGQPKRITAHITLGKYHNIEVEDDVTAFLEYPGGATGVFITSTGEAPGSDVFEIIGDRGKMNLSAGNRIEMVLADESINDFCRSTPHAWANPVTNKVTVETPDGGSHKAIHENFIASVLDGAPLIAPGVEGIHSVEMANAMIMSGLTGKGVDLPIDYAAYDRLLADLIEKAKAKKAGK
ncbi:MAG: Gfo/Idh/MocA family oxidoreductase [Planctomycetota bacterium]|nr:Gfo/Idh/MocA family oxidoreductase [Planctomycetota bacterium]